MQTRIALGVEYNGAPFHGWQIQTDGTSTVQQALEAALSRVADHPVSCICAGRTDAGVHATSQTVHFDTPAQRPEKAWVLGGNVHLPETICVRWARTVEPSFHARYSALSRRYVYLIYNSALRSALLSRELARETRPLDVELMNQGAAHLIGEQDFTSVRAAGCQSRTPMRQVFSLVVSRHGDLVVIDIAANAFLQHMVRNIAGVLIDVGSGERRPDWVAELLSVRDRRLGSATAPAGGLYLVQVSYPPEHGLPATASMPHVFNLLGI